MAKPFKWRVDPAPTGPFSSFQSRGWPEMYTNDSEWKLMAEIVNLEGHGYYGHHAKETNLRLKVRIHDYSEGSHKRKVSKQEFKSIAECKLWASKFFETHMHYVGKKDDN